MANASIQEIMDEISGTVDNDDPKYTQRTCEIMLFFVSICDALEVDEGDVDDQRGG